MSLLVPIFRMMCAGCTAAGVLLFFALGGIGCGVHVVQASADATGTGTGASGETIVLFRHGEKPTTGLGQLTCMGLNRALALPKVLIGRFGAANAIYAPDPGDQVSDDGHLYSYVRPVATVEPTAIQLGLPVNTQLSYENITALQSAVTAPAYANSTIFIAWEHGEAYAFAQQMLKTYGLDPSVVPTWSNNNYDMMYVFRISPPSAGAALGTLTFQVQQEGLDGSLSSTCPGQ